MCLLTFPCRYEVTTGTLNKGFYFILIPHNIATYGIKRTIELRADLQARVNGSTWHALVKNDSITTEIVCYEGDSTCVSFVLLFEDITNYNDYRARVQFVPNDVSDFLGNVRFQVQK